MKIKEIRQMGEKELNEKLDETQKELMKINSQIAAGTMPKSPGQVKNYKKTIAKIIAVKGEKEKDNE